MNCGCNDCDCHRDCDCHKDCDNRGDCETEGRRAVRAVWDAKEAKRDARDAVREAKEAVRDAREACDMPSLRGDFGRNGFDNDCGCRN